MSNIDPNGDWAGATKEVAKASREAISTARELSKFISGPAAEVVGMLKDHLKYIRFKRQVRLIDKSKEFLKERGLEGPNRPIPLNTAIPLITTAALEEDDELQDRWAMLLANASDSSFDEEIRTSFISILRDMNSFDVKMIDILAKQPSRSLRTIHMEYPEILSNIDYRVEKSEVCMSERLEISLLNLSRLGCVHFVQAIGGNTLYESSYITPLGIAFVKACSLPK